MKSVTNFFEFQIGLIVTLSIYLRELKRKFQQV
jgi:hypothetical protein